MSKKRTVKSNRKKSRKGFFNEKRKVNVEEGKQGFQRTQPEAVSPSFTAVTTLSPPVSSQATAEAAGATPLPLTGIWSAYVNLEGEKKKVASGPAGERTATVAKRKPSTEVKEKPVQSSDVPRKRQAATNIPKQTVSRYYGEKNSYHAQTRMEITRAVMLLSRISRRNFLQAIPELVQTIHRIAQMIHQHDPRVHGGEPNVMSDTTRATATWIVNNKDKPLVVTDEKTGRQYLDPHASRLLLTAETDLKKNPALKEARQKNFSQSQAELVFSR